MHSQSHSGFSPAGKPTSSAPISTASCIVLPGGTAFPDSLPSHQLNARVGLMNLWKQVQKGQKFVDFTSVGA
jgi:hypothetical protein